MDNRRRFRPAGCDTLEARLVLSQGGAVAAAVSSQGLPNVHNTPSRLGPIGAIGDSYSDEYRFYGPHQHLARNWIEMLHSVRGVNFGPYTTTYRAEPRNEGFAYNWARSSATSVDAVRNQLPGLAGQVAKGQIRYASAFIGGNDLINVLVGAQTGQIPPFEVGAALQTATITLLQNEQTIVTTLLAANPNARVVVWTLPPVTIAPVVQQGLAGNPAAAALVQAVGQATDAFNAEVHALGTNPRVAVADLAAATAKAASSPTGTINVGGQTISLTKPGDDYHNFFLGDGLHVGTIGQGVIADTFVSAIDTKFGEQLFPVTEPEIIRYAQSVQRATTHPHLPQPY